MTVKVIGDRAYIYLNGEYLTNVPKEIKDRTVFQLIVELGL